MTMAVPVCAAISRAFRAARRIAWWEKRKSGPFALTRDLSPNGFSLQFTVPNGCQSAPLESGPQFCSLQTPLFPHAVAESLKFGNFPSVNGSKAHPQLLGQRFLTPDFLDVLRKLFRCCCQGGEPHCLGANDFLFIGVPWRSIWGGNIAFERFIQQESCGWVAGSNPAAYHLRSANPTSADSYTRTDS